MPKIRGETNMGGRGASSISSNVSHENETSMPGDFDEYLGRYGDPDYFGFSNLSAEDAKRLRDEGLNTSAFQAYLDDNNDYTKATIMSEQDFNNYVKENGLSVIYRGVTDTDNLESSVAQNQFLFGDKYFSGNGMFGDGVYFGADWTAERYATKKTNGGLSRGTVIKAVFKPDAKIIRYEDILHKFYENYNKTPDKSMISAFARSQGYDAIYAEHVSRDIWFNILNRGALVASESIRKVER